MCSVRGIHLNINPEEKVVIVGENGSGKSTLVKLIMGYYEATSGEVIVSSRNLADQQNKKIVWENSKIILLLVM